MSSTTMTPETQLGPMDDASAPIPPTTSVRVSTPDYAELRPAHGTGIGSSLDRLFDVSVTATAELGRAKLTIADVVRLSVGMVVPLDRPTSQPVDLMVQGVRLARGEVTVVDDCFAIRITEITDPKKRAKEQRTE